MTPDTSSPWLGRAAVLLLLTALLGIGLISAGLFDPKPLGDQITNLPVTTLSVPAAGSLIHWLDAPLPTPPYSLHLTAAPQSGESDIGYGLALGDESNYLVTAVSPLGYLTVLPIAYSVNTQYAIRNTLLPWQPWPHVRATTNEIWLDQTTHQLTIRINRELLWQGEIESGRHVGLWLESYGTAATVQFQQLQRFTPPSSP